MFDGQAWSERPVPTMGATDGALAELTHLSLGADGSTFAAGAGLLEWQGDEWKRVSLGPIEPAVVTSLWVWSRSDVWLTATECGPDADATPMLLYFDGKQLGRVQFEGACPGLSRIHGRGESVWAISSADVCRRVVP